MSAFPASLLAMVIAAAASAPKGADKRVVFCGAPQSACARLTKLGSTARGFWGELDDAALLAGSRPLPPVLYGSSAEYRYAVRGLDPSEREQAILHRLAAVSAHPETRVFESLRGVLQRGVAVTSAADDLDRILEAAAAIQGGERRMRGIAPSELLRLAREHLASLIAHLPKGPLASRYAREAEALARLAADVQPGSKPSVMPHAEAERAYLVPSISDADRRRCLQEGRHPVKWRNGAVMLLGPRDPARPPWKGQRLRLLYLGRRPFLHDLGDATSAQIRVRLAARMKGPSTQERAEFVADLAFAHAEMLRLLGDSLGRAGVPWISRWRDAVALDNQNLVQAVSTAEPQAHERRSVWLAALRRELALGQALLHDGPHAEHHGALIARAAEQISRLRE